MKNRIKDVEYCGVDREKIRNAKPTLNNEVLENLYEFIVDRYNVHKRKDVDKLPAPWTSNAILQTVKFTNVRREHDRESRNIIENICSKTTLSLKDRFFNIILARFWNKWESYKLATGGNPISFPMSDEDYATCLANIENNAGHTWWSGAYYTCPVRSWHERIHLDKKVPSAEINFSTSPIVFVKHMLTDELWDKMEAAESPEDLFNLLTAIPWMGKFLVYQWFVDFTYCEDYWFSENEYTVSGPGCTKGVNLVFDDRDGMTHEECLFWLRDNQYHIFAKFNYDPNTLFSDLPGHDRWISLMSFENLMCELQKYMKCVQALKDGKKPRGKSSYDGLGLKLKKVQNAVVDLFNIETFALD